LRINCALLIIHAALILSLGFIASRDFGAYQNLFIASSESRGFSPDDIEDFELLTTYGVSFEGSVKHASATYSAVFIATNAEYLAITRGVMKSGGFFTKNAFKYKNRVAVLNEKAAFDIFGETNVAGSEFIYNNERFTAVGVMIDAADEARVYVPASLFPDVRPQTVICAAEYEKELVFNELKEIGVADAFEFISLNDSIRAVRDRFGAALLAAAFCVSAAAAVIAARRFAARFKEFRAALQKYYLRQALKKSRLIFSGLATCLATAAAVAAAASFTETALFLNDRGAAPELLKNLFPVLAARESLSYALFTISIIVNILFVIIIAAWRRRSKI
jgi:hypothetical protein